MTAIAQSSGEEKQKYIKTHILYLKWCNITDILYIINPKATIIKQSYS